MSDRPKNPHAQAPKNPHAVALGRLGGRKGGKARVPKGFSAATPEQRAEWGRKGGKAKKPASATNSPAKAPAELQNRALADGKPK